ncbi:hypothetical protein T265_14217, partial [Opisthorchis viverrini]
MGEAQDTSPKVTESMIRSHTVTTTTTGSMIVTSSLSVATTATQPTLVTVSSATSAISETATKSVSDQARLAMARDSFRQSSDRSRFSGTPTPATTTHAIPSVLPTNLTSVPPVQQVFRPDARARSTQDLSGQLGHDKPAAPGTGPSLFASTATLSRLWNDLSAFKPVARSTPTTAQVGSFIRGREPVVDSSHFVLETSTTLRGSPF